jgi:hypothetical protein
MLRRIRSAGLAGALAALLVAGCGGGRGSVSGTVKVDGQPVDAGDITFVPADGSKDSRAVGASITDGRYEIDAERGLVAGSYKVQINWHKKTGKKAKDVADTGEIKDERKQVLPSNYNSATTLTYDVKAGSNTADFDLKVGAALGTGVTSGAPPGQRKAAGD